MNFLQLPSGAALWRTILATILAGSLVSNYCLWECWRAIDAKLTLIHKEAEANGGGIWLTLGE